VAGEAEERLPKMPDDRKVLVDGEQLYPRDPCELAQRRPGVGEVLQASE
jgi:hypothetical protein